MANVLTHPLSVIDTAGATSTINNFILRMVQWIDDAADIADDDDLVLTINGITMTCKIQLTANTVNNLVLYQIGPFNPGVRVNSFTVTTLDAGVIHVWSGGRWD